MDFLAFLKALQSGKCATQTNVTQPGPFGGPAPTPTPEGQPVQSWYRINDSGLGPKIYFYNRHGGVNEASFSSDQVLSGQFDVVDPMAVPAAPAAATTPA